MMAYSTSFPNGTTALGHFAEIRNMISIGSGGQRELEDWVQFRYAC
jgi:hypothetical protein